MREIVFFLTHDFKPVFRRTLSSVDSAPDGRTVEVLLDDRYDPPEDLNLGRTSIVKLHRHPSPFDPLGQAHNFYLDRLKANPEILESHDRFWVVENDVYFHGNMSEFFDAHAYHNADLLVPEFGCRPRNWCWLKPGQEPCGVTAVIYRASQRLMRLIVERVASGASSHMEVMLADACRSSGMSVMQFIPDLLSFCNTFGSPFERLIKQDISSGGSGYIQRKLYHPVKM